MLSKNFSWLSNLALTIPSKLNVHSVIGIIDMGSSGVIVSRVVSTGLTSRRTGRLLICPPRLKTPLVKSKIFESIKIGMGKSSVVLPALVLDGLHYKI